MGDDIGDEQCSETGGGFSASMVMMRAGMGGRCGEDADCGGGGD